MKIRKMSVYAQVAENLNNKGILPFSARSWNTPLVQSVAYGKINYPEVMEEIKNVLNAMQNERVNV
jgi:hypothetical protein